MKIDKKLTLTHLVSILILASVFGGLGYRLITQSLVEAQTQKFWLMIEDIVLDFDQELDNLTQEVGNIAVSRAMTIYMNEFDDRPILETIRQQDERFDKISILAENGKEELLYNNGQWITAAESYTYDEGFLDSRWEPNKSVLRIESNRNGYHDQITINYYKKDFFDDFAGSLRVVSHLSGLLERILILPEDSFLLVVDPENRLVYQKNAADWAPRLGSFFSCDEQSSDKMSFSQCHQTEIFSLSKTHSNSGLKFVVGMPGHIFNKPIITTRNTLLGALTLLVLLAVIVSIKLARQIQGPLSNLVQASRQIGSGFLDIKVDIEANDELGELGKAFNTMSESLQKSSEKIEFMAFYDELTGLPNRRLMNNRLHQSLISCQRHEQRGALIMFDLDRFKNINDSLGHATGDQLLIQVANRLLELVRAEDTVSRLSGDEFVVLLPSVEKDGDDILGPVTRIAENIRLALEQPYELNKNNYQVTASIGIALFPHLDDDPDNLLKRADAAMYRSKREGGNRFSFYEKSIQHAADERLHLEKDLFLALEDNLLSLAYQPQCNSDGQMVGVEILARWDHPEMGMVPPPKFIDIAEESGLITRLGDWILEKTCSDLSSIGLTNPNKIIPDFSVNVSAYQFRDPRFYDTVLDLLKKYSIPPSKLKFELTESIVLEDMANSIDLINKFRSVGIQFSLDDFGTGYSSLSYLNRLPLDEIKIDRSFILETEESPKAWKIIEAIIGVAHALELDVVAEGVENKQEIDALTRIGCRIYQGYYFSRPVPFNKFKTFDSDIQAASSQPSSY